MKLGVAAQVEQRMHLHRRLGGAKQRPRKERQTQVDGGRIPCVSRVLQLDTKAVARIELACLLDQALGEFGVDTPVSRLVGIGQRRAFDLLPQAHVVESLADCAERQTSMSRRLSRYVSCTKDITRN